jgi:small nuclear ribonucleoprotein (snRNP)-like protein
MYEQYHVCTNCINRRVSLHTLSGAIHEGVIVKVDEQNVYLDTSSNLEYSQAAISSKKANKKAKTSAFGFGFGFGRERILTLALFDLLAIALIA